MPPATVMHSVTNEKVRLRTINIEIGPRFCMTSTKQNIYPLCTHCPSGHICLPSYPFMLIWSDDGWSQQLQKAYLLAHIWFKLKTSDRISLPFPVQDPSMLTNRSQWYLSLKWPWDLDQLKNYRQYFSKTFNSTLDRLPIVFTLGTSFQVFYNTWGEDPKDWYYSCSHLVYLYVVQPISPDIKHHFFPQYQKHYIEWFHLQFALFVSARRCVCK